MTAWTKTACFIVNKIELKFDSQILQVLVLLYMDEDHSLLLVMHSKFVKSLKV